MSNSKMSRRKFMAISGIGMAAILTGGCQSTPEPTPEPEVLSPKENARLVVQSMDKEALLKKIEDRAYGNMQKYYDCSKGAFASVNDVLHLVENDKVILDGMTSFRGVAGRGETCGVCSACLMVLGMVFGPPGVYMGVDFHEDFVEMNGSSQCGEILEAEFDRTFKFPEEMGAYGEKGSLFCLQIVKDAIRQAAGTIFDELA